MVRTGNDLKGSINFKEYWSVCELMNSKSRGFGISSDPEDSTSRTRKGWQLFDLERMH